MMSTVRIGAPIRCEQRAAPRDHSRTVPKMNGVALFVRDGYKRARLKKSCPMREISHERRLDRGAIRCIRRLLHKGRAAGPNVSHTVKRLPRAR
jgi:hypothetical protein